MATIKQIPSFKKNQFETLAWSEGKSIIGVDEVGRGCLAGPVVVAAVALTTHKRSRLLKDSKEMTEEERLIAYQWIIENSHHGLSIIDHRLIDRHNIYQATLRCMQRAVAQLMVTTHLKPSLIVVDAMPLKLDYFQGDIHYFNFGESKSVSIAAASIIAKVTRDKLMQRLETIIPGYEFSKHKGYSIPRHKGYIHTYGHSIIHRHSFIDHFHDVNQTNYSIFESDTNSSESTY